MKLRITIGNSGLDNDETRVVASIQKKGYTVSISYGELQERLLMSFQDSPLHTFTYTNNSYYWTIPE